MVIDDGDSGGGGGNEDGKKKNITKSVNVITRSHRLKINSIDIKFNLYRMPYVSVCYAFFLHRSSFVSNLIYCPHAISHKLSF